MDLRGRLMGLLIATVVLAISFYGHVFLFDQWRVRQEQQLHRSKILEEVRRLQHLMIDVETNFRGYLLTEQPSFLEPIDTAGHRLESGLTQLEDLTAGTPGLQASVKVLSARLREFIESKKSLIAAVGTDQQEQVRLYVRGGNGRALFLTIERAIGDLEVRIQRELPLEAETYESWMRRARWQLLTLEGLGIMVCMYVAKTLGCPKNRSEEGSAQPV
jgi:CHASE3 domain sensor protein